MAHARHDDSMVPVDVGAAGDLNRRSAWSGAGRDTTDAAMLNCYSVGFAVLTADEVDVVDDKRRVIFNLHLALLNLNKQEVFFVDPTRWFQNDNPTARREPGRKTHSVFDADYFAQSDFWSDSLLSCRPVTRRGGGN